MVPPAGASITATVQLTLERTLSNDGRMNWNKALCLACTICVLSPARANAKGGLCFFALLGRSVDAPEAKALLEPLGSHEADEKRVFATGGWQRRFRARGIELMMD